MQWSDVTAVPQKNTLRQFAGLWLLFFGSLAAWRMWHRHMDLRTEALGVLAVVVGGAGLLRPSTMRWIYTGWMAALLYLASASAIAFWWCHWLEDHPHPSDTWARTAVPDRDDQNSV